ncbi:hypothetical protein EDD37DRAFT_662970 [Exophiala viscosa]|uniref:Uncharacterized protein n=1 Tax=Exophiala viscosa TaxID=2486360 RepID=A0AAN6IHT8_9EURO|nr:hypothetical protein EDD36DRAFT_22628 [Exophiala viscosa]KAI1627253.1 hypothetical protein EDD37DRAFT_662970 [Exophiala viscosa]
MSTGLGHCSLEPAYLIEMYVTAANPVGELDSGSTFVHYEFSVGSMSTVEGYTGPHIDGQVVNAGDWLYIDPSQEHASVNVKGVVRTLNGASLYFSWNGHAYLDDDTMASFPRAVESERAPFGRLTTLNSFKSGDPSFKALNNTCFVGNGRYIVKNGQIGVEARLARVVPSKHDV